MSTTLLSIIYIFFCCNVYGKPHGHESLKRERHFPAHRLYHNYYDSYDDFDLQHTVTGSVVDSEEKTSKRSKWFKRKNPRVRKKAKKVLRGAGKAAMTIATLPTSIFCCFGAFGTCKHGAELIEEDVQEGVKYIQEKKPLRTAVQYIQDEKPVRTALRQPWFDWKMYFVEGIISAYIGGGWIEIENVGTAKFYNIVRWIEGKPEEKVKVRRQKRDKQEIWKKRMALQRELERMEMEKADAEVNEMQNALETKESIVGNILMQYIPNINGLTGIYKRVQAHSCRIKQDFHKIKSKIMKETDEIVKATLRDTILNNLKPWVVYTLKVAFKCTVQGGWNIAKRKLAKHAEVKFEAYDYMKHKEAEEKYEHEPAHKIPVIEAITTFFEQKLFDSAVDIANDQYELQRENVLKIVEQKIDGYLAEDERLEGSLLLCVAEWLKEEAKHYVGEMIRILMLWLDQVFDHAKKFIAEGSGIKYDEDKDIAKHYLLPKPEVNNI